MRGCIVNQIHAHLGLVHLSKPRRPAASANHFDLEDPISLARAAPTAWTPSQSARDPANPEAISRIGGLEVSSSFTLDGGAFGYRLNSSEGTSRLSATHARPATPNPAEQQSFSLQQPSPCQSLVTLA